MRTDLGRRRVGGLGAVLCLVLAGGACATSDDEDATATTSGADRPTIVVTTSILGDVTANVVGDLAEVEVLVPAGADPHTFEPSARQAAELRDADLVIANGLGLESGLAETLDAAAEEGTPVLELGPELSPVPFDEHAGETEDDHAGEAEDDHSDEGDDHGDEDPHIWMDPDRMAAAAPLIAEWVASETTLDGAQLDAQARAYQEQLYATDEEVQAILATVPADRRTLVTNHEALGYFADRYGFEVVATVIPGGGTDAEPSAERIAELAEVLAAEGVPAIFAENVDDTSLAETLAAEVGGEVAVVTLYTDALGGPGSGAETYRDLLVTDAELIAAALAG